MNISAERASRTIFALAFLLLLLPSRVNAEIKNFAFSGTITVVQNHEFQLDESVAVGTRFEGFYVFDTTAVADSNADTTVGDYRFRDSKFGVVVKVGNYVFRTNPQHVDFLIEVVNRAGNDAYLLRSYKNVCSKPVAIDHISWQLNDSTGNAITHDLLPISPPVLSQWQSTFGLSLSGLSSSFFVRGHVTSINETPAVIPKSPAVTLDEALEVKWQSRLGYYYQIQRSDDLETWTDVGEPVLGDGTELSRFFPRPRAKKVFYRAEIANFQK